MAYEPHQPRRIKRSAVPHARLPRHSRLRREMMVGVLVAGTMLLVVGMYAATFRYQSVFTRPNEDAPRWSALSDDFIERARPVGVQFDRLKRSVMAVSEAAKTRAQTAEVLKRKLEARASATATPETP